MRVIASELAKGNLPPGYKLTIQDVGSMLSLGWGRVKSKDVGKRVWWRTFGLVIENDDQAQ